MSKVLVNGYADRAEHIKALMAQGMSKKDAHMTEAQEFMAEVVRRRRATLAAQGVKPGQWFEDWKRANGVA